MQLAVGCWQQGDMDYYYHYRILYEGMFSSDVLTLLGFLVVFIEDTMKSEHFKSFVMKHGSSFIFKGGLHSTVQLSKICLYD